MKSVQELEKMSLEQLMSEVRDMRKHRKGAWMFQRGVLSGPNETKEEEMKRQIASLAKVVQYNEVLLDLIISKLLPDLGSPPN